MSDVKIFWDPHGFTLDSLGGARYLRSTDGDTPSVSVSIRMLSIDAPEVHYPGRAAPSKADEDLAQLAAWIEQGRAPVSDALAAYLHPRLATGRAGSLQESHGKQAFAVFEQMLERLLTRPNGSKRELYMQTADEQFDSYGRLLAYIAPSYTAEERERLSKWERASFNLLMVRAGWAATMIIYPSIPRYEDLVMFRDAAKEAYLAGRGVWAEPLMLTGYEFRMAVKLFQVTRRLVQGESLRDYERMSWVERYCVDMTTRAIYFPADYFRIAPYNRLFVWPKDVNDAVGRLNLNPPD